MPNPIPTPAPAARQHAFKGLADWIEVFRAGSHTDSKGRACSFTEADLDQMASNVTLGAPPAVLGHPKHNDPAYAWAELKRAGASLFAKFSDINPDFEAGVASGAYRNRSVSIVKDAEHGWRVQHIGWLGAAPPAIPGLKPVDLADFAAQSTDVHSFMDSDDLPIAWAFGDVAVLFRRLRDWLISKDGIEAADQVLTDYQITGISEQAARIREAALREAEASPFFTQQTGAAMAFQQADLDRVAAETEARVRAETAAQFTAQSTALQQLQSERQAERIGAQIAGWKAAGLVTPAEEPGLREFMAAFESAAAEFTFTAASSEVKKTPAQWFAEFIAGRKPVVKLGASLVDPGHDVQPVDLADSRAIARAAQEFQAAEAKDGRAISIELAVAHVTSRGA